MRNETLATRADTEGEMETNSHTSSRLLTLAEAMELLGISRTTLWRLTRCGDLPVVRIGTRRLIEPQALRDFIAASSGRR
jgi:excisionase family DNA binding protein